MQRIARNLTVAVLVCVALCLAGAVVLGAKQSKPHIEAASQAAETASPAESFRTLRQQLRAMEKAQLNDIAHGTDVDDGLRATAQRQLLDLCTWEEQEMTLEGVLALRGYEGSIVTVHADSVNVMIPAEAISRQESAVVMELVCRETGVQSGNVKIIPVN